MATDLRVARRIDALFKAMSTDFLLREQFVTDPAQIMAEYVTGSSLPEDAADVSNQMLYAVLSNGRFLQWLVRYAQRANGQATTSSTFAVDFAQAVSAYGDRQVVGALIRSAQKPDDFFASAANLLLAFIGVLGSSQLPESPPAQNGHTGAQRSSTPRGAVGVFAAGARQGPAGAAAHAAVTERRPVFTERSPGITELTELTEISPGFTEATEISPGLTDITAITEITALTEISPGVTEFTEISPGITEITALTEISPGVTEFTEISPGITEITALTEISPGVTEFTEISPGITEITALTEISPGGLTGIIDIADGGVSHNGEGGAQIVFPRHLQATMASLIEFARQLRTAGALDLVSSE